MSPQLAPGRDRREAQPSAPTDAPFVVVTGGKGGVGKTTLSANLGVCLAARQGLGRALLVDLDFGLANLDVVLGMRVEKSCEDFFAGAPLEGCLSEGPGGVRVLPAASGSLQLGRPDEGRRRRLFAGLSALRSDYGIVLGDSAAGIGPDVLDFAVRADRVVVVTTPDPAAATDAYGVIKALDTLAREREEDIPTPWIFVNLARDTAQAREVAGRLREVCERFLARSPRMIGWMPPSRALRTAALLQRPFVLSDPRSSGAQRIRRLADRLASTPVGRALKATD